MSYFAELTTDSGDIGSSYRRGKMYAAGARSFGSLSQAAINTAITKAAAKVSIAPVTINATKKIDAVLKVTRLAPDAKKVAASFGMPDAADRKVLIEKTKQMLAALLVEEDNAAAISQEVAYRATVCKKTYGNIGKVYGDLDGYDVLMLGPNMAPTLVGEGTDKAANVAKLKSIMADTIAAIEKSDSFWAKYQPYIIAGGAAVGLLVVYMIVRKRG